MLNEMIDKRAMVCFFAELSGKAERWVHGLNAN